jgi:hypothetical protein
MDYIKWNPSIGVFTGRACVCVCIPDYYTSRRTRSFVAIGRELFVHMCLEPLVQSSSMLASVLCTARRAVPVDQCQVDQQPTIGRKPKTLMRGPAHNNGRV